MEHLLDSFKEPWEMTRKESLRNMPEVYDKEGNEISGLFGDKPVLNQDGTLTVYHATTKEGAETISKEGLRDFKNIEHGEVYVSTKPKGGAGFGGKDAYVVELKIKPNYLVLDDAFRDGELHLHGNEKDFATIKPVSIKKVSDVKNDLPLTDELFHKQSVQRALSEGKPVPAEVLKDYPDLKPAAKEPYQMTFNEFKKSPDAPPGELDTSPGHYMGGQTN